MNVSACSFDSFRAETAAYDGMGYLELLRQVLHPLYGGFTVCERLSALWGQKEMKLGRETRDSGGLN